VEINKQNFFDNNALIIAVHILFGVLISFNGFLVPLLICLITVLFIFKLALNDSSKINTFRIIAYLTSLEILYRATGVTFLPYELSKYIQIFFCFYTIILNTNAKFHQIGFFIILLTLPSLLLFEYNIYKYLVFNSFGIYALAVFVSFSAFQKISVQSFASILLSFIYPVISFLVLITIRTPSFDEISFDLGANFETSGGFGSNQVSTVLGAFCCCLVLLIILKKAISNRYWLTYSLLVYALFRGLITFSRGGMFGFLISLILPWLFFKRISITNFFQMAGFLILSILIFIFSNNLTGGQLLLRFQGETAGTLDGVKEKNSENVTSGRSIVFESDLNIWEDNLLLGVGPGKSQFIRYKYGLDMDVAPHVEFSRLLAENGIFGLIINIILVFWPVFIINRTKSSQFRFIKAVLFIFAYSSTFHSAMRNGIAPLFYALASLDIYEES
jgi:hypothetical protein